MLQKKEDKIIWPQSSEGRPRRKVFLNEIDDTLPGFSSIIGKELFTRDGTMEIDDLFGKRIFDFPKPSELIMQIIEQVLENQARAARNAELDAQQAKWLADAPKRAAEGEQNYNQAGEAYKAKVEAEAQAAADKAYNSPHAKWKRDQAAKAELGLRILDNMTK